MVALDDTADSLPGRRPSTVRTASGCAFVCERFVTPLVTTGIGTSLDNAAALNVMHPNSRLDRVAERPVTCLSLGSHSGEHRNESGECQDSCRMASCDANRERTVFALGI